MPVSSQPTPLWISKLTTPHRSPMPVRERSGSSPEPEGVLDTPVRIKLTKAHDELHHPPFNNKSTGAIEGPVPIKKEESREVTPAEHTEGSVMHSRPSNSGPPDPGLPGQGRARRSGSTSQHTQSVRHGSTSRSPIDSSPPQEGSSRPVLAHFPTTGHEYTSPTTFVPSNTHPMSTSIPLIPPSQTPFSSLPQTEPHPLYMLPLDPTKLSPEQQEVLINAHYQILLLDAQRQQQEQPFPSHQPSATQPFLPPHPPQAMLSNLSQFPSHHSSSSSLPHVPSSFPNTSHDLSSLYASLGIASSNFSLTQQQSPGGPFSPQSVSHPSTQPFGTQPQHASQSPSQGSSSSLPAPHAPAIDTQGARPIAAPFPGAAPTSPSDSTPEEEDLDDAAVIAEDKRRRNTAASARFRIKKKQRVVNLERNIQDLSERADDLEKEAGELRKENELLREMVVLKGRQAMGVSGVGETSGGSGSNTVLTRTAGSGPSSTQGGTTSGQGGRANIGKGKGTDKEKDDDEEEEENRSGDGNN